MIELFIGTIVVIGAYWLGKFKGVDDAFEFLEKEGKVTDKDELKDLMKWIFYEVRLWLIHAKIVETKIW